MKHFLAALFFLLVPAASHAALQKAPEPEGPIPDLKPPLESLPILVEKRSWAWAWLTGGVLLTGLVTTFAVAVRKKTAEVVSPYVLARNELEAARNGSDPTIVWSIFRNYVHTRYGIKHGVTPGELITALAAVVTLWETTQADMKRLFDECEIASFSNAKNTVPDLVGRAMALLNVLESQQSGVVSASA